MFGLMLFGHFDGLPAGRETGQETLKVAAFVEPAVMPVTAGAEQITSFGVDLAVRQDGSMHVLETIGYDFGADRKHGIERDIPVEFAVDKTRNRKYPISGIKVSSPTGAPADTEVIGGAVTTIRVGDPNNANVTGLQSYVIEYDLEGVVNSFQDHQELYWNAIGNQWGVPINAATVTVRGPAAVQKVACFKGLKGSTDTCSATIGSTGRASFTGTQLQAHQGMTVVSSFPAGTFPGAAPIFSARPQPRTTAEAFSLTPATGLGSLGLLALLGGLISRASGRGRDEYFVGLIPGTQPGFGQQPIVARVPRFHRDPIAVQFTPPPGMRPGQLGTLIDKRADVVDVTATIVDLAVRGYIRIEVTEKAKGLSADWNLTTVFPAPTGQLLEYELQLLSSIFPNRNQVMLSTLKQSFKSHLRAVQSALYVDVTRAGWFRENPSTVRTRWVAYGVALTLLGAFITYFLTIASNFGLLGLAVLLPGLAMLALSQGMPARTALGTVMLSQAKGFKMYLEKAEANQIRFEEGEDVFSRYLPFAIVFGVTERWAAVFAALAANGVAVTAPNWYVGSTYSQGAFDFTAFGNSLDSFSTTTSGSIAASTPLSSGSSSGSSGFDSGGSSGDGGGGGGGSSW